MKNLVFGISYPYRCPDCPELRPFKSRVKFATHRRARHAAPELEPPLYDPEPAPLRCSVISIQLDEPGHRTGALPSLDAYDEVAR